MFLSYPSGLVIYWTISNLWAIGQQYLTTIAGAAAGKSEELSDAHGQDAPRFPTSCRPWPRRWASSSRQPPRRWPTACASTSKARTARCSSGGRERRWPPCSTSSPRSTATRPTEGRRLVVDCLGYRKGKDAELRQMAIFLGEKAKTTGLAQEIGPLNPYERRIVHLAVSEIRGYRLREHRRRVREDRHHLGQVGAGSGLQLMLGPAASRSATTA